MGEECCASFLNVHRTRISMKQLFMIMLGFALASPAFAVPKAHVRAMMGELSDMEMPADPYGAVVPSSVGAAPPATPSATDCARAAVYICKDWNWGGACQRLTPCLGSGPQQCGKLDGTASSIGPDKGFKCLFYKTGDCSDPPGPSGGVLAVEWPGISNLVSAEPRNTWNDIIRSYQCLPQD
ncbi:hypothetical protein K491DRAFT_712637 [Lophiostoma macrostomum CBS 122681]|uniref:Uncharacterized protein n=1 Tax=Lophiostoma macrostomum CBS 122681 TaxID=1314788 RepID=A0A6A6THZ1_9PLEO|nr:hypothetical protein K491DRAFT_712637 [Lophiostoma macrostomum CBS 122681]